MHHLIIFGFVLLSMVSGDSHDQTYCSIYGDPYLTSFVLRTNEQSQPTLLSCNLPRSRRALFRNQDAAINVVNSGSGWDMIIDFMIQFFNDVDDGEDCFITPSDMKYHANARTCGPASIVSVSSRRINIHYEKAGLLIQVDAMGSGDHFKIQLWISQEKAESSKGMCHSGCPIKQIQTRSMLSRTLSQDQTISSLASQICDIYLREFQHTAKNVVQFIEATRQACVNDLTITGNRQFAEEAVSNVVALLATQNATSYHDIQTSQQQASVTIERIISTANRDVDRLVADYPSKQRLIV